MDLGLVAQTARRVGAATDLRGADRLAVSVRLLLPLLQPQAAAGSELARDLRAAVAGRDSVTLLLPPGAAQGAAAARLEVGGRQFALPPALRDALLAALAQPGSGATAAGNGPGAAAPATAALPNAAVVASPPPAGGAEAFARSWAVAAQTTAAAAQLVGGSGVTRQLQRTREDAPPPTVRFAQPLLTPVGELQPAAAIAERLRTGIERSGLFFESHLAQWARGERGADELRAEALRVLPQPAGEAAQRVAAQLALLQDGGLRVEAPAWPGQAAVLTIEREPHAAPDDAQADAADGGGSARMAVFVATLTLDLPRHGPVAVRLRLAGHAISAQLTAADPQPFAAALGLLAERLAAQGLLPVQMQAQEQVQMHAQMHARAAVLGPA